MEAAAARAEEEEKEKEEKEEKQADPKTEESKGVEQQGGESARRQSQTSILSENEEHHEEDAEEKADGGDDKKEKKDDVDAKHDDVDDKDADNPKRRRERKLKQKKKKKAEDHDKIERAPLAVLDPFFAEKGTVVRNTAEEPCNICAVEGLPNRFTLDPPLLIPFFFFFPFQHQCERAAKERRGIMREEKGFVGRNTSRRAVQFLCQNQWRGRNCPTRVMRDWIRFQPSMLVISLSYTVLVSHWIKLEVSALRIPFVLQLSDGESLPAWFCEKKILVAETRVLDWSNGLIVLLATTASLFVSSREI